jgi:hypothetical protein
MKVYYYNNKTVIDFEKEFKEIYKLDKNLIKREIVEEHDDIIFTYYLLNDDKLFLKEIISSDNENLDAVNFSEVFVKICNDLKKEGIIIDLSTSFINSRDKDNVIINFIYVTIKKTRKKLEERSKNY